jgi:hypothetical protein
MPGAFGMPSPPFGHAPKLRTFECENCLSRLNNTSILPRIECGMCGGEFLPLSDEYDGDLKTGIYYRHKLYSKEAYEHQLELEHAPMSIWDENENLNETGKAGLEMLLMQEVARGIDCFEMYLDLYTKFENWEREKHGEALDS